MSIGQSSPGYSRGQASSMGRLQAGLTNWSCLSLGVQHALITLATTAVFARFMGFNLSLALVMSAVATVLSLLVVRGKVPGYLGASVSFVPAVIAMRATGASSPQIMGAFLVVGLVVTLMGLLVHIAGGQLISDLLPAPVTGAIMMLIGLNLAPTVIQQYWKTDYWLAVVTALAIVVLGAALRGVWARLSIPLGLAVGVAFAWLLDRNAPITSAIPGQNLRTPTGAACLLESPSCVAMPFAHSRLDFSAVTSGAFWQLPAFDSPAFSLTTVVIALPFVLLALAETTTHVKTVGYLLDHRSNAGTTTTYRPRRRRSQPLIPSLGRALMGSGLGTMVSTAFGGAPTTVESQHVRTMASSRVLAATPLYYAAAVVAGLAFLAPVSELLAAIPMAVIGGAGLVLCGLVALAGARTWVDNRVDFAQPANLFPLAAGLLVALGDLGISPNSTYPVTGVALGCLVIVVFYHLFNAFSAADSLPTHMEESSVDWQDTSPVSLIDLRQYGQNQAKPELATEPVSSPATVVRPPRANTPTFNASVSGGPVGGGASPVAQTQPDQAMLRMPGVPVHFQPGSGNSSDQV